MSRSVDILFVGGMHRTGTSAISGHLVNLGGKVPDDVLPPTEDNPEGFFESRTVVDINEKSLELVGSHWRDPSRLPHDWLARVGDSALRTACAGVPQSKSTAWRNADCQGPSTFEDHLVLAGGCRGAGGRIRADQDVPGPGQRRQVFVEAKSHTFPTCTAVVVPLLP